MTENPQSVIGSPPRRNLSGVRALVLVLSLVGCGTMDTDDREVPAWAQARPSVHSSRSGPVGREPGVGEPGIAEPGIGEPGIGEPRIAEPRIAEPRIATTEPASRASIQDRESDLPRGAAEPEPVPPEGGPIGAEAPGAGAPPPDSAARVALDDEEIRRDVRSLVRRLEGERETAEEAYSDLCVVDERLIPRLLEYVESDRPTRLDRLELVVLQKDFSRYDDERGTFVYQIQGLSPLLLDDIAAGRRGIGRYRGATRVRIGRVDGFPLGVVVRAGLLTRIKGERLPAYPSERGLRRWWQDYWRLAVAS